MTRKFFKIIIVLALFAWVTMELKHAQGQRDAVAVPHNAFVSASSRAHGELRVEASGGSFVLKNLRLERMKGSTILKGSIFNKTKRRYGQVSFLVKAYDREGKLLKGPEAETIFTAQRLKASASVPINHGYGVWLQGVSLDNVARIEISELNTEASASNAARMIPFASHALELQRDSGVEE